MRRGTRGGEETRGAGRGRGGGRGRSHLVLKALDRVCELTDVAEAIRTVELLPAHHQVEVLPLGVGEVGGDDLVARAAEAELHEADDLR